MKKIILLIPFLILLSCNKNQMQISRAAFTVIEGIDDHSPIYFEKNTKHPDSLIVNRNNEVSGTNFILSVQRDLNLLSVATEVQAIIDKKYKEKLHKDEKGIFFSYADTLHKNLAFFPVKDITYVFSHPQEDHYLLYTDVSGEVFFENKPVKKEDLTKVLEGKDAIQLAFSKSLTFEKYLQMRIYLQELDLENKVNKTDFIY